MTIVILTLLIVLSLAAIALPYLGRRARIASANEEAMEIANGLRRARDRVYEEIRTLQQEYFLQHLSEDEYREQLKEARFQAASLAREQHGIQQSLLAIEQAVDAEMAEAAHAMEERSEPSEDRHS